MVAHAACKRASLAGVNAWGGDGGVCVFEQGGLKEERSDDTLVSEGHRERRETGVFKDGDRRRIQATLRRHCGNAFSNGW